MQPSDGSPSNTSTLFLGSGGQAAPKPLFPSSSHDSLTSSQLRKLDGPRRDSLEGTMQSSATTKNTTEDLSQISQIPLSRSASADQVATSRSFPTPYHGISVTTSATTQKPSNPTAAQMVMRVRELMNVTSDQLQTFTKFPVAPFQLPNPANFLLKNFNVDITPRLPTSSVPQASSTTTPAARSSAISPFTGLNSLRKDAPPVPLPVTAQPVQFPSTVPPKRSVPTPVWSANSRQRPTTPEVVPPSDRVTRASATATKPAAKPRERPASPPKASPRRTTKRPLPEDDVTGSEEEEEEEQEEQPEEEEANEANPESEQQEEAAAQKEDEAQYEEIGGEEAEGAADAAEPPADDYVNAYEEELEEEPEEEEMLVVPSDSSDGSAALGALYDQSDDEFVERRSKARSRQKAANKLRSTVYRPLVAPSPRLRGLAQYNVRSERRNYFPTQPPTQTQAPKKQPQAKKSRTQSPPAAADQFGKTLGPVPQLELHAQPVSYLRTLLSSFLIQPKPNTV